MQLSFLRGSTTYLVRIDAMPEGHHDVYAPDVFGIETQIGTISPEERIGTLPQTWRALTAFDEPWKGERSVDSAAERIFDDFLNANYAKVTMGGQTFRVEMARDAKHVVQLCQARGQPLQEGAEIALASSRAWPRPDVPHCLILLGQPEHFSRVTLNGLDAVKFTRAFSRLEQGEVLKRLPALRSAFGAQPYPQGTPCFLSSNELYLA